MNMRFPLLLSALLLPCLAWAQAPAPTAKATSTPKPGGKYGPQFKPLKPETPAGVTLITKEVAVYPEHTVTLMVYVPEKAGTYPGILDIHGGGWSQRQVQNDRPMMERLATRGFVTALVSYRLSTEAPYPAALSDCKSALRYLRAHAAEFKLDPERIGVMGGSAGGHLSGLTAMTGGLAQFEGEGPEKGRSTEVKACIVMASTMDLVAANTQKTSENAVKFFGATAQEKPELYAQVSPITHVKAGSPPTIFIEGEKDSLKVGRAEMQEKLKAAGVYTELFTLKDAPHPFWMSQPWCDQVVEIAADFFGKYLGSAK